MVTASCGTLQSKDLCFCCNKCVSAGGLYPGALLNTDHRAPPASGWVPAGIQSSSELLQASEAICTGRRKVAQMSPCLWVAGWGCSRALHLDLLQAKPHATSVPRHRIPPAARFHSLMLTRCWSQAAQGVPGQGGTTVLSCSVGTAPAASSQQLGVHSMCGAQQGCL